MAMSICDFTVQVPVDGSYVSDIHSAGVVGVLAGAIVAKGVAAIGPGNLAARTEIIVMPASSSVPSETRLDIMGLLPVFRPATNDWSQAQVAEPVALVYRNRCIVHAGRDCILGKELVGCVIADAHDQHSRR